MTIPSWMRDRRRVAPVLAATLLLFVINNVLIARINGRYLGGSATGAVTMAFVACLVLAVRARGVPPVVYAAYGLLGTPSHLLAGDPAYPLLVGIIVAAAALFDWLIARGRYRPIGILAAFPAFVFTLQAGSLGLGQALHPSALDVAAEARSLVRSVALGWGGILAGWGAYRLRRPPRDTP
jgi:hypothetical protein